MSQYFPDFNITYNPQQSSFEQVRLRGLTMSLIASGDGTEQIHHHLTAGTDWAIVPQEGWTALETVYLVRGHLTWVSDSGIEHLYQGDVISASPIRKYVVFTAVEDTEFIYTVSQPVFYMYSNNFQELMTLAVAIEEKDGYTSDHCERIKQLSVQLGRQMQLSQAQLFNLNFASFFHDVGKVRVPETILLKPSALTDDEMNVMRAHAIYGKQILLESQLPYLAGAAEIVAQHHERVDGTGYPNNLVGDEILLEASIISVVDSYDAMTTDRPYHQGCTMEEAIAELAKHSGTQFHPEVVEQFIQMIRNNLEI